MSSLPGACLLPRRSFPPRGAAPAPLPAAASPPGAAAPPPRARTTLTPSRPTAAPVPSLSPPAPPPPLPGPAGYDQSVFTYSPEGRIFQVEYAQKAIESSGTAVGVRCRDGVILGVEKLLASKMLVPGSARRLFGVDAHVGIAVAGLLPDARFLVAQAREAARGYKGSFGEACPPRVLNDRMGSLMHMTTVYDSYRPFGAALLLAGFDAETKQHELYCVEPTGMCLRYFGAALGKGQRAAKTDIEKLKFGERSCGPESLALVAKILLGVHDEAKDKPMEVELGWVCAASGWKYEAVPAAMREAAVASAKAQIAAEEGADDDDDDDAGEAMAGAAAPVPAS